MKSVLLQYFLSTLKILKRKNFAVCSFNFFECMWLRLCFMLSFKSVFQSKLKSWFLLILCFFYFCRIWSLFVREWSSIFIFCLFYWSRLWEMIFMKFFYQNQSVFFYCCVWFSCSLFVFFSFDQKFKLCFLNSSSHIVNQVNKIQIFFTFNSHRWWFKHLLFHQIMLWE